LTFDVNSKEKNGKSGMMEKWNIGNIQEIRATGYPEKHQWNDNGPSRFLFSDDD